MHCNIHLSDARSGALTRTENVILCERVTEETIENESQKKVRWQIHA